MCRLFALHADRPVTARFWLLDAPYSLVHQSQFNADGTGIGWFDDEGAPHVLKRPVAAHSSARYARIASDLRSQAMIAHVRNSSGTANELANTHPFLMDDIVIAHNGVLRVTDGLRARVRELGAERLVEGETDSEWLAALITGETAVHEGNLHDGLVAAVTWVLANVPVYSLNLVAAREEHLYALRLPETNELWVRDRPAGGRHADGLEQSSDTLRATSDELREVRSVVIASEPMDDSDQWRLLADGELLHVSPTGEVGSEMPFEAPAHRLGIEDLGLSEAASQAHAAEAEARDARRSRSDRERRRAA
ncbi:class II glutamine amidotransferase [Brachybacterium endophyticum]|uniref:Class II glutamine amidotransferase n=1 Tax=Brachybacterium endophyticum TaxID=2182385 RepID=A0A2U2RJX0_9MICO|nr:class II glutamine amidotransferase [Brachybacterium endophyticum]PWH06131.1 class II glutamine amidotransferase [Brachybacterium endophyticum]